MRLINQLFLYFMVLVTLQACTESNQETDTQAAQSQENLRDIAYDAFIYAYPLMEQCSCGWQNASHEFIEIGRRKS